MDKPAIGNPVTREGHPIPFFPIGKRVVIERIPKETKIGEFIIPESYQVEQNYATVLAAGPRAQEILDDAGINIGDTICIGKWSGVFWEWQPAGTEGRLNMKKVDLISVDDIFGCKELADKMIDGRMGMVKKTLADGGYEWRFAEETK
jgi:co-chaperonin GroES (HSP10)